MMPSRNMVARAVLPLVAVVGLGACGVKQDRHDADLQALRDQLQEDMRAGDQQVADEAGRRIDALGSQVSGLENRLGAFASEFEATVARLEARLEVDMPVHFAYDDATVREGDRAGLDEFARVIREHHPGVLITVEGFTDPAGDADYNRWLGQQRANAVREYLVGSGGLNPDQVRAVSYGEAAERQVVKGAWGERGEANRRVALVIEFVREGGAPMATRDEG